MEIFFKDSWQLKAVKYFCKKFHLDVWQGSKYARAMWACDTIPASQLESTTMSSSCLADDGKNISQNTLHKNEVFPIRISSVKVTKSAGTEDLVTFTEEINEWKIVK